MRLKTFESFTKVNEAKIDVTFNDDVRKFFPEQADEIIDIVENTSDSLSNVEKTLVKLNKIVKGDGVKTLKGKHKNNHTWADVILVYINFGGDTNKKTIMYDIDYRKFLIGTYSSWVDLHADEYEIL